MAISRAGTFDYVAIVPERSGAAEFECLGDLSEPIDITGDDRRDSRLVGHAAGHRVRGGVDRGGRGDQPGLSRLSGREGPRAFACHRGLGEHHRRLDLTRGDGPIRSQQEPAGVLGREREPVPLVEGDRPGGVGPRADQGSGR